MDKLVISAIFRNESLYLREWLEFHLLVGVSKFYLYQNRSDDAWEPLLAPYRDSGVVEVIDWPLASPCQFLAYENAIEKLAGQDIWCAFIDCDEFLFSPQFDTVPEAMRFFPKKWGAVGVNWMCFGSSNWEEYAPGSVIERFTWRPKTKSDFNRHIKSIVRMNQDVWVGDTPHSFRTEKGTFSEAGEPISGPFSVCHRSDILRINHYSSKSRQEWLTRSKLGKPDRPNSMPIEAEWYEKRQAMDVDDRSIFKFLPALKERLK